MELTHRVPMFENDEVKVWKTIIVPNSPLAMHRHEYGRTIVVWLDADRPGDKKHADVNETTETIEIVVIEQKN